MKLIGYRYSALLFMTPGLALGLVIVLAASTQLYAAEKRNQSINIEVTTHLGDKQKFKQGDKIAFLVSLDRDAHLLMIYQDAANNLIQVIPNQYREKTLYKEGLFIAVPDRSEPFEFVVNPPFGTEKLWVFASSKKFPALEGTRLNNGLMKLETSLQEIISSIRPKNSAIQFGESSTVITTETQ